MKYSKIKGYLKVLGNVSILKTLYINLKLFPFFQAIKLPIVIGKGTIIRRVGRVILNCPARPALLTMGVLYLFNDKKSNQGIWDNAGTIVISGKVTLHTGLCLYTKSKGKISFGGVNQIDRKIFSNFMAYSNHGYRFSLYGKCRDGNYL